MTLFFYFQIEIAAKREEIATRVFCNLLVYFFFSQSQIPKFAKCTVRPVEGSKDLSILFCFRRKNYSYMALQRHLCVAVKGDS